MRHNFFTWFPVVTGASERKLRRRERGTERVQTERVRELRPREFQLLSFWDRDRWDRESRVSAWVKLLKPKLRERQSFSFSFSFCFFLSGAEFCFRLHFKWNSSLLETSSSSKFYSSSASIRGNRGSHAWQTEDDVAGLRCNSSLGETSSSWNSSLQETRRLSPKFVFQQYFFAK